LRMI